MKCKECSYYFELKRKYRQFPGRGKCLAFGDRNRNVTETEENCKAIRENIITEAQLKHEQK